MTPPPTRAPIRKSRLRRVSGIKRQPQKASPEATLASPKSPEDKHATARVTSPAVNLRNSSRKKRVKKSKPNRFSFLVMLLAAATVFCSFMSAILYHFVIIPESDRPQLAGVEQVLLKREKAVDEHVRVKRIKVSSEKNKLQRVQSKIHNTTAIAENSLPGYHTQKLIHDKPFQVQQAAVPKTSSSNAGWASGFLRGGKTSSDGVTGGEELVDMRILNAQLAFDNPDGGAWKQGWDVQPTSYSEENPLHVFVLAHSHCDPGWIKTFDSYFHQQTSEIITTVITALQKDARRKFIWAEISYFSWWWEGQNENMRNSVRKLLENKQLEFVTGGWVQPDEANSELFAMEVQLQEGHDWIRQTFGAEYIPKYGWSIDPFGYSSTSAWLQKQYGFKAILIQRVHYAVKKELARKKQLEFYWRQTWDRGEHDIFTHVMPFFSYDVPHTCGPDPAVCCQFDFHRAPVGRGATCPWHRPPVAINDNNVKERSLMLLDQYAKKAALYRTNTVLVPLGDDFRYQKSFEAENQFINHQKIHDYINKNVPGATIEFGTLSQYFEAVTKKFKPPVLKGSFFTYSDVNEDYWSGYFTSRAFDKALDRQLERVLFAAESMGADKQQLQMPRRALSLFQHHDGVTGTAKHHVVEDYAARIHKAIAFTQDWMVRHAEESRQLSSWVDDGHKLGPCLKSDSPRGLAQNLCLSSTTMTIGGGSSPVLLYNPLASPQLCGDVEVPGREWIEGTLPCEKVPDSDEYPLVRFDKATGRMLEPVREEWKVWKVNKGGAYLFNPGRMIDYQGDDPLEVERGGFVVRTPHWKRTVVPKQVPSNLGVHGGNGKTVTVFDFIYEIDLQMDNQEWFVRFTPDKRIENKGLLYTDLNGFNFDTHYFRKDMPIQSQVFPMPTLACIRDGSTSMTVLSEHAQGVASLQDSSLDIWLDRRLSQDDERGLGEGVQDNRPIRTRLRVVLEPSPIDQAGDVEQEFDVTSLTRELWDELQHPLEMFGVHSNEISAEVAANVVTRRRMTKGHRSVDNTAVPFVYMVYKRLDYLQQAIASLRQSDFPRERVPLIISHDGRVPDVYDYVESLKKEFPELIQIIHPHSCYSHPDSFPGNAAYLNEGYKGDTYGNPRSPWATCCKHHFTWIMKTVFSMDGLDHAETFVFLEEDYIVNPKIYSALVTGLNVMETLDTTKVPTGGFLGIGLDPTRGGDESIPSQVQPNEWFLQPFKSGPMTLNRNFYSLLQQYAADYCKFDEYNWDWSLVHVMSHRRANKIPFTLLSLGSVLASHIGFDEGMHADQHKDKPHILHLQPIDASDKVHTSAEGPIPHAKGNGGWGHSADQDHCMNLLQVQ